MNKMFNFRNSPAQCIETISGFKMLNFRETDSNYCFTLTKNVEKPIPGKLLSLFKLLQGRLKTNSIMA
jgi:hypothetical protein